MRDDLDKNTINTIMFITIIIYMEVCKQYNGVNVERTVQFMENVFGVKNQKDQELM